MPSLIPRYQNNLIVLSLNPTPGIRDTTPETKLQDVQKDVSTKCSESHDETESFKECVVGDDDFDCDGEDEVDGEPESYDIEVSACRGGVWDIDVVKYLHSLNCP